MYMVTAMDAAAFVGVIAANVLVQAIDSAASLRSQRLSSIGKMLALCFDELSCLRPCIVLQLTT